MLSEIQLIYVKVLPTVYIYGELTLSRRWAIVCFLFFKWGFLIACFPSNVHPSVCKLFTFWFHLVNFYQKILGWRRFVFVQIKIPRKAVKICWRLLKISCTRTKEPTLNKRRQSFLGWWKFKNYLKFYLAVWVYRGGFRRGRSRRPPPPPKKKKRERERRRGERKQGGNDTFNKRHFCVSITSSNS